jgi:hypothetical protein
LRVRIVLKKLSDLFIAATQFFQKANFTLLSITLLSITPGKVLTKRKL